MKVHGRNYKTVWMKGQSVFMIDQTALPFGFKIVEAKTHQATCRAIKRMVVRGAGAIGAAAAFAMAQAFCEAPANRLERYVKDARKRIEATRPTAQNLFFAVAKVFESALNSLSPGKEGKKEASRLVSKDEKDCLAIGRLGAKLFGTRTSVATHCNAGWLAFVDHGTALAPVYCAAKAGKKVFVYVDETRPRGQGAKLTAWELGQEKIPHVVVADCAQASLMAQGKIDLVIVGADRIAANGDTANKIGTLDKALCAKHYRVPFYVAAPSSTFDLSCATGKGIPIEERDAEEVLCVSGLGPRRREMKVRVAAPGSGALNPAFDVTPAELISGIITEKGIIKPSRAAITKLFKRNPLNEKKEAGKTPAKV